MASVFLASEDSKMIGLQQMKVFLLEAKLNSLLTGDHVVSQTRHGYNQRLPTVRLSEKKTHGTCSSHILIILSRYCKSLIILSQTDYTRYSLEPCLEQVRSSNITVTDTDIVTFVLTATITLFVTVTKLVSLLSTQFQVHDFSQLNNEAKINKIQNKSPCTDHIASKPVRET